MIGHVYLVNEVDTNNYKIGLAQQPHKRLSELGVGNPRKLKLSSYFLVAKPREVEKYLHYKLHGNNIRGEWFTLPEYLLSQVFCRLSDISLPCDCCPSFARPK